MTFKHLPPSTPTPGAQFEFDANVNSATIDEYLGNPDVVYYDTRPLVDTFEVEPFGFRKEIEFTIEGFRVVPYCLIGTVPDIGIFGLSFSKGFDQTWLNLWRKDDGYSLDFYQNVETDDEDDDVVDSKVMISTEAGEDLLCRVLEDGKVEQWADTYTSENGEAGYSFSWTLDIDDLEENDLLFSSGNGVIPQKALFMAVLEAVRAYEPRFAMGFEGLR